MLKNCIACAQDDEKAIEGKQFEQECLAETNLYRLEWKSVRFLKCRFEHCDFSKNSFENVTFVNCDFSNCVFEESYWSGSALTDSKGDGGIFLQSRWNKTTLSGCSFRYANFSQTVWDHCRVRNCCFCEACLSEMKLKQFLAKGTDFSRADFFGTLLNGVDLSDCAIGGILVSDTWKEWRGAQISPLQAMDLVPLLGVRIKDGS